MPDKLLKTCSIAKQSFFTSNGHDPPTIHLILNSAMSTNTESQMLNLYYRIQEVVNRHPHSFHRGVRPAAILQIKCLYFQEHLSFVPIDAHVRTEIQGLHDRMSVLADQLASRRALLNTSSLMGELEFLAICAETLSGKVFEAISTSDS